MTALAAPAGSGHGDTPRLAVVEWFFAPDLEAAMPRLLETTGAQLRAAGVKDASMERLEGPGDAAALYVMPRLWLEGLPTAELRGERVETGRTIARFRDRGDVVMEITIDDEEVQGDTARLALALRPVGHDAWTPFLVKVELKQEKGTWRLAALDYGAPPGDRGYTDFGGLPPAYRLDAPDFVRTVHQRLVREAKEEQEKARQEVEKAKP